MESKKVRSRNAGFDGTNPFCKTTYICGNCGKKTRETGQSESGVGLCAKCYEEAGLENEHSDYGHETYNPKCPTCRSEAPKKSHKKLPRECVFNENGNCLQIGGKPCDKSKRNEHKCLAFATHLFESGNDESGPSKHDVPIETQTKLCHHCQQTKPVADFYKSKTSKSGYAPSCKSCQNITWRDQN